MTVLMVIVPFLINNIDYILVLCNYLISKAKAQGA